MTFLGGRPPLEETPSKTCQRGSRHPIPLKLFPHGYNKSFLGDIGNEGPPLERVMEENREECCCRTSLPSLHPCYSDFTFLWT